MSTYDNTNTGALFPNEKGDNPKRPDFKGTINVGGTDYNVAGWRKESKNGKKFLSLKLDQKTDVGNQSANNDEDEIPF
jgi:uncharacterized protein (DUF736 family)